MPVTYHIVHLNAQYYTRIVGRRRKEFIKSVCGEILPRERGQSCNNTIADPSWNYDWCYGCVKAFPWTEDARKIWLKKGIETMDEATWKEWINSPEGEYAKP